MSLKYQSQSNNFTTTFSQTSKSFGTNMGNTQNVTELLRGATFTPSVSEDGIISWTNDGGLSNPSSVNIKGAKGDKGDTGANGAPGADGRNGADGKDGKDGYTPIKGVDYFDGKNGKDGENGKDGRGIQSVEQWYYNSKYSEDTKGDSWSRLYPTWQEGRYLWIRTVVTYTDGTSQTISEVCVTGSKGATGLPGATPVKGTDYYTEADKAEMVSAVLAALPVYDGSVVSV